MFVLYFILKIHAFALYLDVFFFKQKTAYEMRISDWSSDVCSSDLVPGVMLINDAFFNEFTLELSKEARPVVRALADRGVLAGVSLGRLYPAEESLANGLVVAVTETTTAEDVATFADRKSPRLNSIPYSASRLPDSAGKKKSTQQN